MSCLTLNEASLARWWSCVPCGRFPKTVILLLQNGANPNIRSRNGNTPLHEAAEGGSAKVRLLAIVEHKCVRARKKCELRREMIFCDTKSMKRNCCRPTFLSISTRCPNCVFVQLEVDPRVLNPKMMKSENFRPLTPNPFCGS